jgi:hypothetical protein
LSSRRIDGTDLALVSGFAYAALLAGRNIGPFALVAAPVLSRHVATLESDLWSRRERIRRRATKTQALVNWTLLIIVVALAVVKISRPLQPAFNRRLQRETMPAGAVVWIEEHQPQGPMFNHYNWGGYLIWHLWPDYRVFVDGRTDLYGDEFLREYLRVQWAKPSFDETLDAHDVRLILMPPDSVLSTQLACKETWREAYRDEIAMVWVREGVEE